MKPNLQVDDPKTFSLLNESSLVDQLIRESEAMAKYAFGSGLEIPFQNVQTIVDFASDKSGIQSQSRDSLSQLVETHTKLAQIVHPATPRGILFISTESSRRQLWGFFGQVSQVRRMMFVAIIFLIAFIVIPMHESVDGKSGDPLVYDGIILLLNELYFVSAAGIGSSIYLLFKVTKYIIKGTYDPKYESYYWIRFILGLMAGMILASLLPSVPLISDETLGFARPTLALLGGFSAAGVYSILEKLMDKVKLRFGVKKK